MLQVIYIRLKLILLILGMIAFLDESHFEFGRVKLDLVALIELKLVLIQRT